MGSGVDEGRKNSKTTFSGTDSKSGTKHDSGKARLSLIPREFLEETARAFDFGAAKYGENNFKAGIDVTRTLDAALRHIMAFLDGEDNDPDSKTVSHLGHAAASLAMTLYTLKHHPNRDNRFKKPKS